MIHKFVLTGGPSAGKTTGIAKLEQKLRDRGYAVYVVDETSTALILSGIRPWEVHNLAFQKALYDIQKAKEKAFEEVANTQSNVVILSDTPHH